MALNPRFAVASSPERPAPSRFAIAGADDEVDELVPQRRHRLRRRRSGSGDALEGSFWAFVVADGAGEANPASSSDYVAVPMGPGAYAVGAVELRWTLHLSGSPDAATHHTAALSVLGPHSGIVGYLAYETSASITFVAPVQLDSVDAAKPFDISILVVGDRLKPELIRGTSCGGAPRRNFVHGFVVVERASSCQALQSGTVVRSIALKTRSDLAKRLIKGGPTEAYVHSWTRGEGKKRRARRRWPG